ncbi:hypothetical protein Tco_0459230 [Tanacetum coccineum]
MIQQYFRELLLEMKDEAGSNIKDEKYDFMLDNSYEDETLEELTAAVIMMARILSADDNAASEPSYNAKAVSEKIMAGIPEHDSNALLCHEFMILKMLALNVQKNEMLRNELEKSSSDSKDIQANLLKRIKILENDFKRLQAQTKTQVDSVVKEKEIIKLEYQKLFNSIKATRTQHQKEIDELIKHVNQKTYAYADVRAQNQDLLMTIFELKNKLKTVDKGKNVNTKFDKSETSGTLLCVTLLPKT